MDVGSVLGLNGTTDGSLTEIVGDSTLGRDDFLELLLVQLQMQDPLEPMDNREMVAQLAQFSSLEQLENMNTSLENALETDLLIGQLLSNTMSTTLIGRRVSARASSFALSGDGDVSLAYDLSAAADAVRVSILDETGMVVATLDGLDGEEGQHDFSWDGCDDHGTRLPSGTYTFAVSAEDDQGNVVDAEGLLVGTVEGVRYEDGFARLLIGGQEVLMSDVLEILQGEQR